MAVSIETLRRWDRSGHFKASERRGVRGDRYYTEEHIGTYLRLNSNRAVMPKLSVNDVPDFLSQTKQPNGEGEDK